MTTLATVFLVIALLCAVTSIYFSAKALRRLKNAARLLDQVFQHDPNYQHWKNSKEQPE